MKSTRNVVAAHVTDKNRETWDKFAQLTFESNLSLSAALEQAACLWLWSRGHPVFADPTPLRTVKINPLCDCHAPVDVPVDVAPWFDRYLCPPRIVTVGDDE